MKILLVEDSATLRFAMESYIGEAGHETIVAENGETAVQIVDQTPIDMVIMDVEMPGLDGFDTTRLIRESLGERWIPIIFVTGKSDDESLRKGIAVGGDDYLIKPISKVILQAKIGAMERIANMSRQLHQLNEKLVHLSQRDSLTQLYNRRSFEEKAQEAWRLAMRNKTPLTILLFDIDYFKRYNDTYGHVSGDECLRKVAQTIASCFNRPGDVVARYGGEEFIALLPNTHLSGAKHTAETIRAAVENLQIPHEASPEYQRVTLSIGGASLKYTTGTNLENQIETADQALYQSKSAGRNCAHIRSHENFHSVLFIGQLTSDQSIVRETLDDHCNLSMVSDTSDMEQLHIGHKPQLVLLKTDTETDESLKLFSELDTRLRLRNTPLVLISSMNKDKVKTIGRQVGANASLSAPIDRDKLIAKLALYLDR